MSLLHYITYKLVIIRDKRLGAVYYAFASLIILYTTIQLVVMKEYLEFDSSPKGSLRILLSDHSDDSGDLSLNITEEIPKYCHCNKASRCRDIRCEPVDVQELSWPVESKIVSIMTFCKERWQVKHEEKLSYDTVREKKYFTLHPEKVLLKIEHSITATRFSNKAGQDTLAASQRSLNGLLYDVTGTIIKRIQTNGKKGRGQADKFTIEELLNAAGINNLETPSDAINAKGKTYRRHGIVLQVFIRYHNAETTWVGTSNIEYSYHVRHIPFADYRINQVIPVISYTDSSTINNTNNEVPKSELRLFRKRYGIKIEFFQTGKLGRFSLSSLLFRLVSGVSLLTLTATLVDLAALYILPDKYKYRRFVYEESPILQSKKDS